MRVSMGVLLGIAITLTGRLEEDVPEIVIVVGHKICSSKSLYSIL